MALLSPVLGVSHHKISRNYEEWGQLSIYEAPYKPNNFILVYSHNCVTCQIV